LGRNRVRSGTTLFAKFSPGKGENRILGFGFVEESESSGEESEEDGDESEDDDGESESETGTEDEEDEKQVYIPAIPIVFNTLNK